MFQMRILKKADYHQEAEPILRQVFVKDNPSEEVFADKIQDRKIIYRYKYEIDPNFAQALIEAASSIGDSGCYLSLLWQTARPNHANHCYIPFSEFWSTYVEKENENYSKIRFFCVSENVLYSPQAKWGIMFSHEGYALLGGVSNFMAEISKLVPNLDSQVYQFLEYLQYCKANYYGTQLDWWLPRLLSHVYGQEIAERMLTETGLP